jgi:DNA-directed RNA polymerase subunit RPC12/RpoP
MPRWTLACSKCTNIFTHSQIDAREKKRPFDELWPAKPDLPNGGARISCPHCGTATNYQRFQLVYSPE